MLRSIIRRPASLRAFSTGNVLRNEAAKASQSSELMELSSVLHDAAERAPATGPKMELAHLAEGTRTTSNLREFPDTSIIRPYELTYQSRRARPSHVRRTPAVGPNVREARQRDIFYSLGLDPLDYATTPEVLNHFMSSMGKINTRPVTGLTRKNQRRIGKAIRRARMMGLIPVFSTRKNQLITNPVTDLEDNDEFQ
ncbi:ribosomal protein S18 [Mucidula mucida]|nr:ribosomal protein S18 [Mucidula mucida]